mmetsp:Transcript_53149/g.124473  ORF Transcript_53149/g.124473 Transcript_53149/m.124473 type:complete len:239 (+) Transcript_53149:384-1100(+)
MLGFTGQREVDPVDLLDRAVRRASVAGVFAELAETDRLGHDTHVKVRDGDAVGVGDRLPVGLQRRTQPESQRQHPRGFVPLETAVFAAVRHAGRAVGGALRVHEGHHGSGGVGLADQQGPADEVAGVAGVDRHELVDACRPRLQLLQGAHALWRRPDAQVGPAAKARTPQLLLDQVGGGAQVLLNLDLEHQPPVLVDLVHRHQRRAGGDDQADGDAHHQLDQAQTAGGEVHGRHPHEG